MKIILLGYMGSGKSSVGTHLAQKMQLPFLDLDHEISRTEGMEIPEIFRTKGEIYFRRKETEVLSSLLTEDNSFVLALGGGTPCYGKNLQLLKEDSESVLVYLKASLEALCGRLKEERGERPLIAHLSDEEALEDYIRKHLFERNFYYNQSEHIINADDLDVESISEEITSALD